MIDTRQFQAFFRASGENDETSAERITGEISELRHAYMEEMLKRRRKR